MRRVGWMLALVAGLVGSCGIGGQRQFRDAFPDPGVLVTTVDPVRVRAELANVQLPDNEAHNMHLLSMLREQKTVDAAHLVLLVRAVALPQNITCSTNGVRWTYPTRGDSDNAAFVDQLLTEGAAKLDEVDSYWLGELIGISQSDVTMMLLCEQYVPAVDDGSAGAFDELLRGMPGSPALLPFLSKYMGPQGRLDGPRGWRAFERMSFDNDRVALLSTLLQRNDELSDERVLMAMKAFSFDGGRKKALDMLVKRASPLDAETARAAVSTFSFDSGRSAAFATLAKRGGMVLEESQLARFVDLCSFDSGRIKCVKLFSPKLQGQPRGKDASKLLGAFSFDSDRLKAVELMASRWVKLPSKDRFALLEAFSFDSSRKKATRVLMR